MLRALGEKFVQLKMADNTVAPFFGREQSMDKKFAGCKIEMTPLLTVPWKLLDAGGRDDAMGEKLSPE